MFSIKRYYFKSSPRVRASRYNFGVTAEDELQAYLSLPEFYLFDLIFKIKYIIFWAITWLSVPIFIVYISYQNGEWSSEKVIDYGIAIPFMWACLYTFMIFLADEVSWGQDKFDVICREVQLKFLLQLLKYKHWTGDKEFLFKGWILGIDYSNGDRPNLSEYKGYKNTTAISGSLKHSQFINNCIFDVEGKYNLIYNVCPRLGHISQFIRAWNESITSLSGYKDERISFIKTKQARFELSNFFYNLSPQYIKKPTKQKNIIAFEFSEDGKIVDCTHFYNVHTHIEYEKY